MSAPQFDRARSTEGSSASDSRPGAVDGRVLDTRFRLSWLAQGSRASNPRLIAVERRMVDLQNSIAQSRKKMLGIQSSTRLGRHQDAGRSSSTARSVRRTFHTPIPDRGPPGSRAPPARRSGALSRPWPARLRVRLNPASARPRDDEGTAVSARPGCAEFHGSERWGTRSRGGSRGGMSVPPAPLRLSEPTSPRPH